MSKRHHQFFYSFLAVMLVLTLGYGIRQNVKYQQAARWLEDAYQSALADAAVHLNGLNTNLEKLLLTGGTGSSAVLLSRISQQAGEAQSSLALLPISRQTGEGLLRFLAQTEEYARVLAARAGGWTEAEARQLERMAAQAGLLWGQLEGARSQMAATNRPIFLDVQLYYLDAPEEASPLYEMGGSGVEYPTLIYDGAFSDQKPTGSPRGLPEGEVTHEQALEIARAFVGPERVTDVAMAPDALGEIPAWGVQVETADGTFNVEVTRQGGKVLWMMPEHGGFEPLMTLAECQEKAESFLSSRGFDPVRVSDYQVYEGVATFQFAAVQEGVILYPDQVKVQCRLDTGAVVGLDAHHYWMNHVRREKLTPTLTVEEARKKVSPRLTITGETLCLIPQNGKERLCYEFAGTWEDGTYRLYLDANTGEQAEILKIITDSQGIWTA